MPLVPSQKRLVVTAGLLSTKHLGPTIVRCPQNFAAQSWAQEYVVAHGLRSNLATSQWGGKRPHGTRRGRFPRSKSR